MPKTIKLDALLGRYFQLIRKLLPQRKPAFTVGLDIGLNECKLVELKKMGKEIELTQVICLPVEQGNIKACIETILKQSQSECTSPATALFGKGTLIRFISMPKMALGDLKNSFALEADKYFPFAQDQIYTDCMILDNQTEGKQMSVLAAASQKELVDQRIKLLSELGYQANFVGMNSMAIANVFSEIPSDAEEDVLVTALLDMGESISTLTIIVDNLPRFTRDIYIGGRDFTKRISNALGVEYEEAEKLKRDPGDKNKEVTTACESSIMNIVQELRLSFDYFTTERNMEISILKLTGGASLLKDTCDIFARNLDVKVERWDPLKNIKLADKLNKEDIQKTSLKIGVALGLALYSND